MTQHVEWRTRGEVDDAIVVVDEDKNVVRQVLEANPTVLKVFLNDMIDQETWRDAPWVDDAKSDPDAWGELVMARADSGEVLDMDPELFWDGIYLWFRSRGVDPNLMRGR